MRIVALIPSNATTGGVELLYQFVHIANSVGFLLMFAITHSLIK